MADLHRKTDDAGEGQLDGEGERIVGRTFVASEL
jgi:hypothetical protein